MIYLNEEKINRRKAHMADLIEKFLHMFTDNNILSTILSSCFPLIELKGAIPVGTKLGLPLWQSAIFAYLGSTLVIIPIFFLLIPIFKLLKKIPGLGRFFLKLEIVLKNKAASVAKKSPTGEASDEATLRVLRIALLIFVAVPLPLTGVWTGAAIAVFLGLSFKDSIIPLALGNFIAGGIITLMTLIFKDYVDIIINVIFALAVIMLFVTIIKVVRAKPEEDKENKAAETDEKRE